nr:hypothetical protein [Tanacetum cinerariifolium]
IGEERSQSPSQSTDKSTRQEKHRPEGPKEMNSPRRRTPQGDELPKETNSPK